jgi:large subunit ribosomal protein L4e
MKTAVYSVDGKSLSEIDVPAVFNTPVDKELIKRAVLSIQSARRQPKSPSVLSNRDNTALYIGSRHKPTMYRIINTENARLPRMKNRRGLLQGKVAGVPQAVGGPKAHPPKKEKVLEEKINKKEKKKATNSAIAATANPAMVKARGHKVSEKIKLPIVVEAKAEKLDKTKKVMLMLNSIGLGDDVKNAKEKKRVRAGKGRKRGHKYKTSKSVLIVTKENSSLAKAARNISGVEVVAVKNLNAELLAPGCMPGRLTLWSEAAIKELK